MNRNKPWRTFWQSITYLPNQVVWRGSPNLEEDGGVPFHIGSSVANVLVKVFYRHKTRKPCVSVELQRDWQSTRKVWITEEGREEPYPISLRPNEIEELTDIFGEFCTECGRPLAPKHKPIPRTQNPT